MPLTLTWLRDFDGMYPTFHLICEQKVVGRDPRGLGRRISESLARPDYSQIRIESTFYIGVADIAMSRAHFSIRRAENEHGPARFWIRDLRSHSGTMVNGACNDGDSERLLEGGETIRAGGADLIFNQR